MKSEVYNCDCVEYMRTLPDKCFQLAIADPPYGDGHGGGMIDSKAEQLSPGTRRNYPPQQRDITPSAYGNAERVTRTGGTWAEKYKKKL